MENIVLENEKEKLESVIKQYHEVFEDVTLALNSQRKRPMSDPIAYNNILMQYENKLKVLENGFKKPYFARIDFTSNDDGKEEVCYIGKVGVSDYDSNIITVVNGTIKMYKKGNIKMYKNEHFYSTQVHLLLYSNLQIGGDNK